jgi:hypothetical protein
LKDKPDDWESADPTDQNSGDYDDLSEANRDKPRSSRWDAAGDPNVPGAIPQTGPPGVWDDGSSQMYLPPGYQVPMS